MSFFGDRIFEFIEKVRLLYSDSTRFFIPESLDELKEYIAGFKENTDILPNA